MYRNGNKVAIVTGTSHGVGAAMASRLGTDGRRTRWARRDGAAAGASESHPGGSSSTIPFFPPHTSFTSLASNWHSRSGRNRGDRRQWPAADYCSCDLRLTVAGKRYRRLTTLNRI